MDSHNGGPSETIAASYVGNGKPGWPHELANET